MNLNLNKLRRTKINLEEPELTLMDINEPKKDLNGLK